MLRRRIASLDEVPVSLREHYAAREHGGFELQVDRGGAIGRPLAKPPIDAERRIEDLAAEGRGIVGVSVMLRTDRKTFHRWMAEHPELAEAFERGKERDRHELHELMLRDARDGGRPNINAMFLLKARHGYREGDPGDQPSRLNITFNLPGAMTREDFLQTVVPEQVSHARDD